LELPLRKDNYGEAVKGPVLLTRRDFKYSTVFSSPLVLAAVGWQVWLPLAQGSEAADRVRTK